MTGRSASVGVCKGGPLNGRIHAQMDGRRHELAGLGAYVYQPTKKGNGTWVWLAAKKDPK